MPIESINLSSAKKSDFVPTQEELRTIQEKMKDPEFMKLMTEYMNSLEDPAYRKEEEEYLAQVEREAKESGDNSFDFVFPKPNYFVELLQGVGKDQEGSRVFINMCTSEKIEEYKEETTNRRDASNWTVPVSIGRPRPDTFEGKPACVYDAVFHPKTLSLGERSDRFMTFLVEIAVENINSGHKRQYGYGYRRMSSSSSKVISVGVPQNMTVSRPKSAANGGKSIFDLAKEQSVLTKPTQFNKDGTATLSEATGRGVGGGTAGYSPSGAASATTATSNSRGEPPTASAKPTKPADNLPPFSITHRGVVDLLDTWNWKVSDKRTGVPKQLVVTATFAGVNSAAVLEMDVSEDGSRVDIHKTANHPFHGSIVLPFTVEETPSSAKFDKKKSVLTLVLDVKATTIPLADLPNTKATPEAAEDANDTQEPEPTVHTEAPPSFSESARRNIDVQSAAPSASPARPAAKEEEAKRSAEPTQQKGDDSENRSNLDDTVDRELKEEGSTASSTVHVDPSAGLESDETFENSPRQTNSAPTASPATPASGFEPDANDRMQEVMRKISEAKRQREEAERIEREAEQAVREAEEAEEERKRQSALDAAREEEKNNKAATEAEATNQSQRSVENDNEGGSAAEPLEVIDLRNRQAEWLQGVKDDSSVAAASADTANPSFNEALASAVQAAVKESSGGLLDDLEDDEDEESLAKKREMKRKLREIQRQEEAAREAERLNSLMKQKMAELPLRCRHIFEIE